MTIKFFTRTVLGLVCLLWSSYSYAQSSFKTANEYVKPYTEDFGYGNNLGYYSNGWDDKSVATLLSKIGTNTLRPTLPDAFIEEWGPTVRLNTFRSYSEELGLKDLTCFIEKPSSAHQDKKKYSGSSEPSKLFANLYEPIWNSDGTVNPQNYYADYVYKLVQTYGDYIKFWEVVNEPDYVSGVDVSNWLTRAPLPSETVNTRAPFYHYIRMLRITWEVVKKYNPDDYVAPGGIGYKEFLDAMLRYTDNPVDGSVTSQYPNKGGAYFDVLSYHVYPSHYLRTWENGGFKYLQNSDYAAAQVIKHKDGLEEVLNKYGYNGSTYPKKHVIITETNVSRRTVDWRYGSDEMQRNYATKALVLAQKNNIKQLHFFISAEFADAPAATQSVTSSYEHKLMGFYENLSRDKPGSEKITPSGKAFYTTTKLLKGYRYDASRTAALKMPETVEGAAFSKSGEYVYVLWAKNPTTGTEKYSTNYSFPVTWNFSSLTRYEWDYSSTGKTTVHSPQNITLSSNPAFFVGKIANSQTPVTTTCSATGTIL
ncbi:hypothetical protein, partial [Pontibacter silvestris]